MSLPQPAEPRSPAMLARALWLGQHALLAVLLLVAWGRAAGERPWFEAVAAALGLLYVALAGAEWRGSKIPTYAVFLLLASRP